MSWIALARIDVLIAVGHGDPRAMAAEASGGQVTVHTAHDVAAAVRVATELIAPGDVVFVKASSEYGLDVCARALSAP